MVLKPDQERVMSLLKDTITLLCKNGLSFKSKFAIDAVIGVTVDEDELFYIAVKELVKSEVSDGHSEAGISSNSDEENGRPVKKHRRRKRPIIKNEEDSNFVESRHRPETSLAESQQRHNESSVLPVDFPESPLKKQCIKIERGSENDDCSNDEDIVFIKEELDDHDDSWSMSDSQTSKTLTNTGHNSLSHLPQLSQDHHSQSLPNVSLLPLGSEEQGNMLWNTSFAGEQVQDSFHSGVPAAIPGSSQQHAFDGDLQQSGQEMQQMIFVGDGYKCVICNQVLKNKYYLKAHLDCHKGVYRYRCKVCGKGFQASNNLRGHMVWHTGIKEYKCSHCDKEYRHKNHLKRHLITSHGIGNIVDNDP